MGKRLENLQTTQPFKNIIILASAIIICAFELLMSGTTNAGDKCLKPHTPRGIFTTTLYSSELSSTSSSRYSNTSGCQRGQPSEEFYTPKGVTYLLGSFDYVAEEAAKGEGPHLEALAQLVGCDNVSSFSKVIQWNYQSLFRRSVCKDEDARDLYLKIKTLSISIHDDS